MSEFLQHVIPSAHFLFAGLISLLLALAIYAVFRLFWRYGLPNINQNWQLRVQKWLPLFETLVWVCFGLFTLGYLTSINPIPALAFSALLAIGFWPSLRNLMTGLIIRLSNRLRIGRQVQIDQKRGVISYMGLLTAEMKIEDGQTLILPYHQISQSKIVLENPSEKVKSQTIEVPANPDWSTTEAQEIIRAQVLNLPWSLPSQLPSVEPIRHSHEQADYRVVLYAIDDKFFPEMEQILIDRLSGEHKTA